MELVSVIEIGVSGARSPVQDIPPREFYEGGLNELTSIGVRQQYLLGFYHKQTWGRNFLDPNYNENQVYARSVDTNSSIMSCYAHTMGLYRANSKETLTQAQIKLARPPVFNSSMFPYLETLLGAYPLPYKLYPIPTHVFNPEVDPLSTDICQKANDQIFMDYMANKDVDQMLNDYSAYLDDVKTTYKLADSSIGKLFLPETVSDILAADFDSRALGLHPATAAKIRELGAKLMPLSYCGKADGTGCKLLAHQLNAYIIDIADDIVYDYSHKAKEERRSYTLLMTSDKMFAALLKSWGYFTNKAIPPASYITIMVNKVDDPSAVSAKDFSVIVAYASEKGKPAMAVPICTNGQCNMDVYLTSMQKALVDTKNITADCTH